tara:strand:+ start:449 stop:1360 length:912 start_codon:yes stop_codon:yes gene_type:complete
MQPFSILGIEYELGEKIIEIKDLFERSERVIARTGIERIYETSYPAEKLALEASNKLIKKLDIKPDCIIYVTQSQKYILPGSGVLIHDQLDLDKKCSVFDINAGCSGFVQALILANNLISTFGNILIICADRYRAKLEKNDRATNAVFSDGASAIMISPNPKIKINIIKNQTKGDFHHMLLQKNIDEDGNTGKLSMSGGELWNFTREYIVPDINDVLSYFRANNKICENIFIHQASKVVVDGIEKELKNSPILHRNYKNRGNTVSSTIPILIKDTNVDINNNNSILSGFGVGLLSYTIGLEKV